MEICAQSIILDNKLQFASADGLSSPPDGWKFENCSLTGSDNKYFVTLGAEGSVTTPPLAGLTGNANIIMLVYPESETYEFNISVIGQGEVTPSTYAYEPRGWRRVCPFLLKNGNADTRIVFSGYNYRICNLTVTDIGDAVFYESYDRCSGGYGQNDEFGFETTKLTNGMLDNPIGEEDFKKVGATAGKKCVFFPEDKSIFTPAIPVSETDGYVVSLKLAGYNKKAMAMSVKYTLNNGKTSKSVINDIPFQEWGDFSVLIPEMDYSKGVEFNGSVCFLDELKIYEVKSLSMSESSSETAVAAEWQDKTVCLSLTRTFQADIWNTCCLPFDFTASLLRTAAGDNDLEVELRRLSDITSEGVFHFESVSTIPAGEPFLLKVGETVSNPVFRNVVMKTLEPASAASLSAPGYAFTGCYGRTTLNTDGTHVFIGTDGELHRPSEAGNTMKGMRAYMELPSHEAARGIAFDERPTGVSHLPSASSSADVLYNLSGQHVKNPATGLYIKNGKIIMMNSK